MTGTKRPPNEWYTPYFAPTTVVIAVTVLIVSVQAGKYVGNYYIQRDKAAITAPYDTVLPVAHQAPTKVTKHAAPAKAHGRAPSKNQP